jgi:hypothetical protein
MRTKLILAVLLLASCAFSATPFLPISCNFEDEDQQFEIPAKVLNTPIIRAYTYQGTSAWSAVGYNAYLSFGEDSSATNMIVTTGVCYATYIDFQIGSNTFARPVEDWYCAVMVTKPAIAGTYSIAYGSLTIKRAPEVNANASFFYTRAINGSEYGPFTGSFSNWPFALAGDYGGYVLGSVFNATSAVFEARIASNTAAISAIVTSTNDLALINAETARATNAETTISNMVIAEISRATNAEHVISNAAVAAVAAIAVETARATNAEAVISNAWAASVTTQANTNANFLARFAAQANTNAGFQSLIVANQTNQVATNSFFQSLFDALAGTNSLFQGWFTAQANTNSGFQSAITGFVGTNVLFQGRFTAQENTNANFLARFAAQAVTNAGLQSQITANQTNQVATNSFFQSLFDALAETNSLFQGFFTAQANTNSGFQSWLTALAGTNSLFQGWFTAQANTNVGFQSAFDAQANTNSTFQVQITANQTNQAATNLYLEGLVSTNDANQQLTNANHEARIASNEEFSTTTQPATNATLQGQITANQTNQAATNLIFETARTNHEERIAANELFRTNAQPATNAALQGQITANHTNQAATNLLFSTLLSGVNTNQAATNALLLALINTNAAIQAVTNAAVSAALTNTAPLVHYHLEYLSVFTNKFTELYVADIPKAGTNLAGLSSGTYTGSLSSVSYTGTTELVVGYTYSWGFTKINWYGTSTLSIGTASMSATALGTTSNDLFVYSGTDTNLVLRLDGDGTSLTFVSNVWVKQITNGSVYVAHNIEVGGDMIVKGLVVTNPSVHIAATGTNVHGLGTMALLNTNGVNGTNTTGTIVSNGIVTSVGTNTPWLTASASGMSGCPSGAASTGDFINVSNYVSVIKTNYYPLQDGIAASNLAHSASTNAEVARQIATNAQAVADAAVPTNAPRFLASLTNNGAAVLESLTVTESIVVSNKLIVAGTEGTGVLVWKGKNAEFANTAVGKNTLANLYANPGDGTNLDSRFNTAIGAEALAALLTGSDNTAVGAGALMDNISGYQNTAVGHNALTLTDSGQFNVAVGVFSANNNRSGSNNVSLGMEASYGITNSSFNIAIGRKAMAAFDGTAVGNRNIAVGYMAMYAPTTAEKNIGIGSDSLLVLTSGSGNTALGDTSAAWLTTGSDNTMIGTGTGDGIATGSGNTILGAHVTGLSASLSNNIILANGTGVIKAQHNGTIWNLATGATINGNVGVGSTNAPAAPLDVNGGAIVRGNLIVTNAGISVIKNVDDACEMTFVNANGGSGAYARLTVGNNTAEADALKVIAMGTNWTTLGGFRQDGGVIEAGNNLSGGLNLMARNAGASMRFYVGGYTDAKLAMTILNNGNVGIGTTNPVEKLDVAGNIVVGTNLYFQALATATNTAAPPTGFGGIRFDGTNYWKWVSTNSQWQIFD